MTTAPAPTDFPTLFSPLSLGSMTLKNRIFSSAHDTVMVHDGQVTDRLIAYHRARAEGGVGLIITQVAGIHESARYTSHVLMVTDDSAIPGYTRLADAVHAHGCKIISQIFHPGREIMESSDGALPVALAPSAVPNERFHVMPRAIAQDEIDEIVRGYADGAVRLARAGFDGVEIVASHGYLPAQFLNPALNRRTDAYGGDLTSRMRFLGEVVSTVRAAVGEGFVVGVRISASDNSFDGVSEDEVVEICRRLDAVGGLDYFNVTQGTSATLAGSTHIVPPMSHEAAYTAPSAARIRAAVSVPVLVAGRINQPHEAEAILSSGSADACAMTRALICDPEMPQKSQDQRVDDIRACIACNQACIGHFHLGYPISCIQRPETGRELDYGTLKPADTSRYVIVVGGGPAGMKAASIAAQRGHRVVLYEAGGRVGGQVLLAEKLPGRSEFGGAATNLEHELKRFGVTVKTRVSVDVDLLVQEQPDVVIVATGASPYRPDMLELDDAMPVVTAWDVITTNAAVLPKGHIVVADWRCDWGGLGVAELIARSGGRKVTLCVNGYSAGETLQQYTRNSMLASALRARVTIVPNARLYGADDDTVYLQNTLTSEPVLIEDASGLVLNLGHAQNDSLLAELRAKAAFEVHGVGDCLSPRTVEEATLDALRVAAEI
ncbi:FAD-dependent oxidoreductase [Amycolatopsis methanolica]|uniref:NADH:flavin oxidoreductase/NADH oxidase n=1 Tax=Amycolatopsis methanolica 239 TaxID=1068978 RepID=A0A076N4D6_AMYME|nr:FAD-dependent oxidoreductase [Amycolatopsis methanolica]AIJ26121.1 NADH:flavin oxidoreductase/NADH oxidase [Amycolatopsis methanolica 239]